MKSRNIVIIAIIFLLVIGGATTAQSIKSSAHKTDSVKSSKTNEQQETNKEKNNVSKDREEKVTSKTEEKKVISKKEAGKIAEDMLQYMHFFIENTMYDDYDMTEDEELWSFLFDCSYAADVEEVSIDEPPYLYKEVTEEFLKEMAQIYGYTKKDLPKIASDYKDIFKYNKESKTYKVNTYSDAGLAFYYLVTFDIEDNNDIKVIVGYTETFDESDEYCDIFEVVLKDLYPKEEEFSYYLYSVDRSKKEYDMVVKEQTEIEEDEELNVGDEETDKGKDKDLDVENSNTLSTNKELEKELAKILPLLEWANDEDYFTSKYSDKEKEEFMCRMLEGYILKTDIIEEKGEGEQYKDVSKDYVEAVISVYNAEFKKLPDIEKECLAKYDTKNKTYRFDTTGNSSYSIEDKINDYTVKADGTIELVVGSYMMYSSDTETERLVEQIEKLDFVKKESKFDDLKIGERVYTLSNNDFENNYFRFSLCGLKYLETEFDQN